MNKEDLVDYLKQLGIEVKNQNLYEEAFTHRSYVNEARRKEGINHNERLEFLGDAVLELIISEYLFHTYPQRPEGELTSFRAATVRTETLASVSRRLGYGEYLRMSNGEESTGGRDKDYLLANTFEAVLGAMYLDLGFAKCEEYVKKTLVTLIADIVEKRLDIDAKTQFQELAQEKYKVTPSYTVLKEEGPDHDKIFTMAVYVNDIEYGIGQGASKQKAEEQAARVALEKLAKEVKNSV